MKKLLMVAGIVGALMLAASPARAKIEITSAMISGGNLKDSIELTGDDMYELAFMAMSFDIENLRPQPKVEIPGRNALRIGYTLEISTFDWSPTLKHVSFVIFPFADGGPLTSVVDRTTLFGQKLTTGFYLADPSMTKLLLKVGVEAPSGFGAAATKTGTAAAETGASERGASVASTQADPLIGVPMVALSLGVLLAAVTITLMLRRSRREPVSA